MPGAKDSSFAATVLGMGESWASASSPRSCSEAWIETAWIETWLQRRKENSARRSSEHSGPLPGWPNSARKLRGPSGAMRRQSCALRTLASARHRASSMLERQPLESQRPGESRTGNRPGAACSGQEGSARQGGATMGQRSCARPSPGCLKIRSLR